jgi:hypothetical protein
MANSLSRAFDRQVARNAERTREANKKAQEEAAALEAKRAELQAAGTPFITTDKFGDLVFDKNSFLYDYNSKGDKVGGQFKVGGEEYVFIPQNIAEKGIISGDKQRYLGNLLVDDNLKALGTEGVYVDLAGVNNYDTAFEEKGWSTTGFLVPAKVASDRKLLTSVRSYDIGKDIGKGMSSGAIKGISEVGGKPVYVTESMGKAQSTWIQPPGTAGYDGQGATGSHQGRYTYTKNNFGFIGDIASSVGQAVGGIPFLPELIGFATGQPYVAAALRGAAAGAAGVDPLVGGLMGGLSAAAVSSALPGPTAGVDYSLTAGGADVGSLGFQIPAGEAAGLQLAPDVVSEGLKLSAAQLAPGLGASIVPVNLGLGAQDYSLLGGTTPDQLATIGETGLTPGAGEGLQLPQVPALPGMGGGQGLSVPVAGGTVTEAGFTPSGATPPLGDPGSFINDPNVLGQPVIETVPGGIGAREVFDALRRANSLSNLLSGPGEAVGGGLVDAGGGFQPTGVEFPLAGVTQVQRAALPSLGPVISPYISKERLSLLSQPSNLLGYQPNFSLLG